jgi:peroxiredoxin
LKAICDCWFLGKASTEKGGTIVNSPSPLFHLRFAWLLLLALVGIATPAQQASAQAPASPTIRAALQPTNERKPAPDFALKDGKGRTITLKNYRGKVVLLDFWATWCHGCKEEIPGFSELQTKYHAKGLEVVGVGMDDEGWKVIKPFLAATKVSYPMLAGDQETFQSYGLRALPDTFLIDGQGRIAAAYVSGLVNQDDVEFNVKSLLARR